MICDVSMSPRPCSRLDWQRAKCTNRAAMSKGWSLRSTGCIADLWRCTSHRSLRNVAGRANDTGGIASVLRRGSMGKPSRARAGEDGTETARRRLAANDMSEGWGAHRSTVGLGRFEWFPCFFTAFEFVPLIGGISFRRRPACSGSTTGGDG